MLKILLPLFLIFVFYGCSDKTYAPNEKMYQEEDLDILIAIEKAKGGNLKQSITIFEKLYDKTNRIQYLIELVKLQIEVKEYTKARQNIASYKQRDIRLERLKVISYLREDDYENALKIAIANTKVSNQNIDYRLVSDIYLNMGEYENAFSYLQSAYAKEQSIQNLLPMVRIMTSYLKKDSDALAYMQTYIKTHGFNEQIYNQILSIHSKNEDINGMKSALEELYSHTKKAEYAQNILNIYSYLNDTQGAIDFLQTSEFDNALLFDLYKSGKKYSKALDLAKKEFQKTKKTFWIANIAILKYELDYPLNDIVNTFEKALKAGEDKAIYLNYYGYVLIDHEIDIKRGIELVKEALKQKPNSVFYIDSLAWGYYKLGKCKEAKELLPKLEKDDSQEILEHIEMIKRCND